ncbi:MAG: XTP/dITP diphosphohydrolase [Planctomycetota bacterium]|jgi:XTP/dITP diphosphohydrolase
MTKVDRILVASGNPKKLREFTVLLAPLGIEVVDPVEFGGLDEVDEDQPTFAGNALKKARIAAEKSGIIALADDSGLEVDALDGRPGVFSARYAGTPCDDAKNNAKLIEELAKVEGEARSARFICALALVTPNGEVLCEVEGTVAGQILTEARGTRDFGYDPLFQFAEPGHPITGKSFAEISMEDKASVSHRGRAVHKLAQYLSEARANRS